MLTSDKINIKRIADNIRLNILKLAYMAGQNGAHIGGGLSLPEILATLYFGIMNISASNNKSPERDRFILSKGHGAIALYAALKEAGFISEKDMLSFKKDGSDFWTHPCKNLRYGIEFSSGSLGQGLSMAAGTALALRKKQNPAHIYVLLGDGECDEGSVWEAAAFVSHHQLNNITVIIDENQLQLDAPTKDIVNKDNLAERWKAFGFVPLCADGHDIEDLLKAFSFKSNKPVAIIARTIKGKGVSFIENDPAWHMCQITQEQYEHALKELKHD